MTSGLHTVNKVLFSGNSIILSYYAERVITALITLIKLEGTLHPVQHVPTFLGWIHAHNISRT